MKKSLGFIKSKIALFAVVAAATAVGGISTSIVMAAIPDSSGVIHGCYRNSAGLLDPKGSLKIIDSATDSCSGSETALNWDQSAPAQGTQYGDLLSLAGKNTNGKDLSFLNLSNKDFTGTAFYSSKLSYSNLTNSNLTNATMLGGYSEGVNFTGATFTDATIPIDFVLDSSNFTNANMAGMTVRFSANNANFSGTNLSNAVFDHAYLEGGNMSTANLTGATWTTTTCPDGTNSDNNGNTCIGHLTP